MLTGKSYISEKLNRRAELDLNKNMAAILRCVHFIYSTHGHPYVWQKGSLSGNR